MNRLVEQKEERLAFNVLVNRVRTMTLMICQENPILAQTFMEPFQVNSFDGMTIGVSFKPLGLEMVQNVPELRLNAVLDPFSKEPSCKLRATFLHYSNDVSLDNMCAAQWEIDRLAFMGHEYDIVWASVGLSLMHWAIGNIDMIKEIIKKYAYKNDEKPE